MLTCLAQGHNMAHLLVSVDRRVMSAAVATELSENPAAVEHTSTKLGDTLPFTIQVGHAVKAILKAPMHLTLLRCTNTQRQSPAPSISFFCFIMQVCYANWYSWATLFTGLHFGCLCCKCCTAQTLPVSSVLGPKNLLLPASLPHFDGTCCPICWFIDFSDKIIVLPFHRDLSSVYNRLGMVFVFESWSLCLTVLQPSVLLLRSLVAFDTRSSPLLPLSCTHPWLWGTSPSKTAPVAPSELLLPSTDTEKLPPATRSLQTSAGLPCPAHPSLVLTLFEWLKIISLTVSLSRLSENKEIKCTGQTISVISITKPKPLNA